MRSFYYFSAQCVRCVWTGIRPSRVLKNCLPTCTVTKSGKPGSSYLFPTSINKYTLSIFLAYFPGLYPYYTSEPYPRSWRGFVVVYPRSTLITVRRACTQMHMQQSYLICEFQNESTETHRHRMKVTPIIWSFVNSKSMITWKMYIFAKSMCMPRFFPFLSHFKVHFLENRIENGTINELKMAQKWLLCVCEQP